MSRKARETLASIRLSNDRREKRSRDLTLLSRHLSANSPIMLMRAFLTLPLVRLSGERIVLLVGLEDDPVWIIARAICY